MRNRNIFRLLSLVLFVTFAFSILATSAMAANRKAVTAAGVIRFDALILFTVDENFIAERIDTGVYLITVDERLECRDYFPQFPGMQTALGPRLATPVAFPGNDHNYYITSELFFVTPDIAGVCNPLAVYQFQLFDLTTGDPVDRGFAFQIIGVRTQVGECILLMIKSPPITAGSFVGSRFLIRFS